ncbi:exosortase-associated protein EpsI, B-type [Methyloradius palustris]|uniref:Methanolan biosynthesis EpsI domain-containing protein n=1 Tax=Methyloradius palustris TaxID=2778876 RepID=A0A8D5G218_9PROT|nr:exosortase-associated protein EpsI, B-type [Methyloradius palustris]BCM24240.1 hypothetical protein ZMTM_04990 [Methyloradius palustris]
METIFNGFPRISLIRSCIILGLFILAFTTALLLTPKLQSNDSAPEFDQTIPSEFGGWKAIPDPFIQVSLTTDKNYSVNLLYDQVLMRTYVNQEGGRIMLAIAYAREQRQDVKIHRPEVCYVAQGFQLISHNDKVLNLPSSKKPVMAHQLLMQNDSRYEAISYWIRIGDEYPSNGIQARLKIFKDGLHGKVLDGVLVRVSTSLNDQSSLTEAYQKQEKFILDLTSALNKPTEALLVAH